MNLKGPFISLVKYYNYHLIVILILKFKPLLFQDASNTPEYIMFLFTGIGGFGKIIGSIVLGKISDKFSKDDSLNIGVILGMIFLLILLFLPSLHILSIPLFVFARFIFTISLSGSSDTARFTAFESAQKYQALLLSMVNFFTKIGITLVYFILFFLQNDSLPEWSWKLSLVFGFLLYMILYIVYCSSIRDGFRSMKLFFQVFFEEVILLKGFQSAISFNKLKLLATVIIAGTVGGMAQFDLIFLPNLFKVYYHVPISEVNFVATINGIIGAFSSLFVGFCIDRTQKPFLICSIGFLIYSILLFYMIFFDYNSIVYLVTGFASAFLVISGIYLMILLSLSYQDQKVRFFSVSHSLGSLFISGFIPFALSYIKTYYGVTVMYSVFYIFLMIFYCVFYFLYKSLRN